MAEHGFRITYATMSADNEELSPIDHDLVIGEFAQATREDVRDAVAAATAFAPAWAATPWKERVALVRRAADLISERRSELAALMSMEVGKNRLEALGDVEESADLLRWNCNEMEKHDAFTSLKLYEVYRDAGIPPAAFQFLSGPGSVVGEELANHPDVDGITFTGSYEVGMGIYKGFAKDYPKPVICEMGGKNPAVATEKADLDKATDGVLRSAFGYGGQKCSANSRVYVQRKVYDEFVRLLKEKTERIRIGDPLEKDVYLGPVIDDNAVATFEEASAEAKKNGNVVMGGDRLKEGDLARGNFVQPTVVEVPLDSWIWKRELFVPFVSVAAYDDLDEALRLANDTEYGLTAGFYSEDRGEIQRFLDTIEAGVVYVNRRAGATTGAWPGVQPFGGWKGSGTSGKAGGGPYYVQQYLREQSRTVIEE